MSGLIDLFIPREKKFFDLLSKQVTLFAAGTKLINKLEKNPHIKTAKLKKLVKLLEKQQLREDKICRQTILSLHQTFITPIDSSEILDLTGGLHRLCLDLVKIMTAVEYLGIKKTDSFFCQQLEILEILSRKLTLIFKNLLAKTNKNYIEKVFDLENRADEVYRKAVGNMFAKYTDAVEIIKHKELYELAEEAIDDAKAIADKVELVLINHS